MKVEVHPKAAKDLERLSEPNKGKIKDSLRNLSKEPPKGDIVPLE